uniref:Sperm microtubule inner protein 5 n=1 Tax=Naja naja TaxID=35670 RepID=A0A8C6X7Z0_NAJNA
MTAFRRQVDEYHPLIPGYTGYIPLRFYRVGTSFGNDSVWCVNTFRDITDRKNDQVAELRHTAATTPQLPPICPNEEILNVLDDYNYKHHPNVLGPVDTKRSFLEPPIPGWGGFVPRSRVTEFGHGVRYHVMAENCYRDFKNSLDRVKDPTGKVPTYVHVEMFFLWSWMGWHCPKQVLCIICFSWTQDSCSKSRWQSWP